MPLRRLSILITAIGIVLIAFLSVLKAGYLLLAALFG